MSARVVTPEKRVPKNVEIASMLRELAFRLDMAGVPFKPRAFEKAAYTVEASERSMEELYARDGLEGLEGIPGVGAGIAHRIEEALKTGRISELDAMRKKMPVDVMRLSAIEGLGPKTIRTLYQKVAVRSLEDLARAAREGKIRHLPGFGEKTEQKILRGIGFLDQCAGRLCLGVALKIARGIEAHLGALRGIQRVCAAGSLRRRKETIGDIDMLVASGDPAEVVERFTRMPDVTHVYAKGETKALVRLASGIDADLRVVPLRSFGAALLYFTGSKDHNVALRKLAQERGLKINEYGLFLGATSLAGRTEESMYEALGLPFIPPELRENRGELEAAQQGRLPRLVDPGDLRGDLQVQTDWTDGANSIEEMAEAALRLGRQYIAITDHTRDLPMARGCDEDKLLEQADAVRSLNRRLKGIRILTGAELNIRKDGTVDIRDDVLARLDVVGAGIHSHFNLPRSEMTRRLIRAMENPHVDILFHPTARILGRRPGIDFDAEAVFEAAARTGTALEIDAQPERLDLKDEHVALALRKGVKLVIDSDAHNTAEMGYPEEFGIGVARRGWAEKKNILNTLPLENFLRHLKGAERS